jgi:glyoxylase-like metal-dependent hydrolase (beta-lactamase superfamily II)
MTLRRLTFAAILAFLPAAASAQSAAPVVAAASKAMGADSLNSITYSGTARNGAFGQSKAIGEPMGPVNLTRITQYTRTINFQTPSDSAALVSRATGPTQPPRVPGVPAPMPGVFNQNITAMQASSNWNQGLNVWTTPWGFLKGAAAGNAIARQDGTQQIVTFSPAVKSPSGKSYSVTGYINAQNLVSKVETRVDNTVVGDLLVEFEYSNYRNMNGVQVPTRIVQKQAGMPTFDAAITAATPNPSNLAQLLTVPPPPAGRAGGPPPGAPPAAGGAPPVEKLGDGVFKIGGNYTSLAVDMGDHILVVESGQSDARGLAVMAAAKQAIPNKRIRYVVNSHPHFDHASGLAAAAAEGATILTHRNNEAVLERLLAGQRSLTGDSLSKKAGRSANVVEAVGDRDTRTGSNGKVVELIRVPNEHSDGMLVVYLPAEKVLWSADVTAINPNPAQLGVLKAVAQTTARAKVDYNAWLQAHPPNPDRPITKADVQATLGATGTN